MQVREEKLKRVLANIFNINIDEIDDATSVDSVPQWDSLKHLNLVLALEHEFNITLSTEQTVEILNYSLIKAVLGEHGIQFKD